MDLPSLRHFQNWGIFHISSDPVEALHGEAWISAIYTDKGLGNSRWFYTADRY
jgi:hypothetical protein